MALLANHRRLHKTVTVPNQIWLHIDTGNHGATTMAFPLQPFLRAVRSAVPQIGKALGHLRGPRTVATSPPSIGAPGPGPNRPPIRGLTGASVVVGFLTSVSEWKHGLPAIWTTFEPLFHVKSPTAFINALQSLNDVSVVGAAGWCVILAAPIVLPIVILVLRRRIG